jgi:hypothetical protein
MQKVKILILVLFFSLSATFAFSSNPPDNTLIKYYSALLTINLNHSLGSSKVIYYLSKEPSFDKNFLEDQLDKIQQHIKFANNNIANIIFNTMDEQKKQIDVYLKNIDEHLSQALLNIQIIRKKLENKEDISPIISKIYYQLNKAENEDHQEIKRILKLKTLDEPLLVVPQN